MGKACFYLASLFVKREPWHCWCRQQHAAAGLLSQHGNGWALIEDNSSHLKCGSPKPILNIILQGHGVERAVCFNKACLSDWAACDGSVSCNQEVTYYFKNEIIKRDIWPLTKPFISSSLFLPTGHNEQGDGLLMEIPPLLGGCSNSQPHPCTRQLKVRL